MDGQWFPRQPVQFVGRGFPAVSGGITVESSSTVEMGDSATEVLTLPGTPAENDIYIVALSRDTEQSVGAAAASAGWTKLYDGGGGAAPVTAVFLKRMTSTPDTTITLEGDSSFNRPTAVAMIQVKGVDTTTALDAALVSATGGSGLPNPPSHTTVTADALRIVTGHLDDDDAGNWTLSGWTVVVKGVGGGTTNGGTVAIAYKLAPSTGAENPGAFSGSGDDDWTATHFSLRPA